MGDFGPGQMNPALGHLPGAGVKSDSREVRLGQGSRSGGINQLRSLVEPVVEQRTFEMHNQFTGKCRGRQGAKVVRFGLWLSWYRRAREVQARNEAGWSGSGSLGDAFKSRANSRFPWAASGR